MTELTKENLLHFLRVVQDEIAFNHNLASPEEALRNESDAALRRGIFTLAEEIIYRFELDPDKRRPC